jgi:glyoxylase-like metal-dependent hydrolase (beta-lactamase superfamily II)
MKIGKYKIDLIQTGTFGLDGGAMFGIIPKPLWQKTNPADDSNRITLGARCLLLKSESKNILVDTGIGTNWDKKFKAIYRVDQSEHTLFNSLKDKGVEPGDITDVILTHLHFDHTGGSVIQNGDKFVPAFSNANYHVQKQHYDWAVNPSDRDRASFVQERFVPLFEEGVLKFVNKENKFDDEIDFILINGHTFAHQMVKLHDSSNTLLFCGDLMPTSSHVPLPYIMGYDLQPLVTLEEKKNILPLAVEQEWKLIFEHDPEIAAASVTIGKKGFEIKERFTELV